jgi:hypothetical protein
VKLTFDVAELSKKKVVCQEYNNLPYFASDIRMIAIYALCFEGKVVQVSEGFFHV